MSATLSHDTQPQSIGHWPQPPVYVPEPLPTTISREDRTVLLAMHAVLTFGAIISIPLIPVTPDSRVFLDLAVVALIAVPGVLLAAFASPGRTWWAVAGPMVAATYLWLPSATYGSIYADAHPLSIIALVVFAPLVHLSAPLLLLGRAQARPWPLVGMAFGVIASPAVVYASVAYPLVA